MIFQIFQCLIFLGVAAIFDTAPHFAPHFASHFTPHFKRIYYSFSLYISSCWKGWRMDCEVHTLMWIKETHPLTFSRNCVNHPMGVWNNLWNITHICCLFIMLNSHQYKQKTSYNSYYRRGNNLLVLQHFSMYLRIYSSWAF